MYYNTFQYSFRIWITTALAVPHIYIIYFFASRGISANVPLGAYLVLVFESVLLSMPTWFVFMPVLDAICRADTSLTVKKLISWAVLEVLLLLFVMIAYAIGGRQTTAQSCFDFVMIGSVMIPAGVFTYKLKVLPAKEEKWRF